MEKGVSPFPLERGAQTGVMDDFKGSKSILKVVGTCMFKKEAN